MCIRHYHSSWCVNFEWINLTSYDNYHPKAQTVGKVVRSRVSGVPQTWCRWWSPWLHAWILSLSLTHQNARRTSSWSRVGCFLRRTVLASSGERGRGRERERGRERKRGRASNLKFLGGQIHSHLPARS